MSEVIFKNTRGEYRVGDCVYAVTSGYGHSINIMDAVITGITPSGGLKIEAEHDVHTWVNAETGAEYNWQTDGPIKKHYGEYRSPDKYFIAKDDVKFVVRVTKEIKKHTLQLNRVMPRAATNG